MNEECCPGFLARDATHIQHTRPHETTRGQLALHPGASPLREGEATFARGDLHLQAPASTCLCLLCCDIQYKRSVVQACSVGSHVVEGAVDIEAYSRADFHTLVRVTDAIAHTAFGSIQPAFRHEVAQGTVRTGEREFVTCLRTHLANYEAAAHLQMGCCTPVGRPTASSGDASLARTRQFL